MPRPKKPPRVRLQIIFEREQAKRLRAFCKERDLEISQVVRRAVEAELRVDQVDGGRIERFGS